MKKKLWSSTIFIATVLLLPISNYAAETEVDVPPVEARLVVPLPSEGIVDASYIVVWNFTNLGIPISNFRIDPQGIPNGTFETTFNTCTPNLATGETCQWAGTFIPRDVGIYTLRVTYEYLINRARLPDAIVNVSAGK